MTNIQDSVRQLIHKFSDRMVMDRNRMDILSDGTVNVEGNVTLYNLTHIPVKFGYVSGRFDIHDSCTMTSLNNCPRSVGDFICNGVPIESLEGGPIEVRDCFNVSNTEIISLRGIPREIGGDIHLREINVLMIDALPKNFYGDMITFPSKCIVSPSFIDRENIPLTTDTFHGMNLGERKTIMYLSGINVAYFSVVKR